MQYGFSHIRDDLLLAQRTVFSKKHINSHKLRGRIFWLFCSLWKMFSSWCFHSETQCRCRQLLIRSILILRVPDKRHLRERLSLRSIDLLLSRDLCTSVHQKVLSRLPCHPIPHPHPLPTQKWISLIYQSSVRFCFRSVRPSISKPKM